MCVYVAGKLTMVNLCGDPDGLAAVVARESRARRSLPDIELIRARVIWLTNI